MKKWSIGIGSCLSVVGHDPEWADMGNPTGALVREVFFVVANDGGDWEWSHTHLFQEKGEAQGLSDRVRSEAERGPWSPVGSDHWHRRKVYGCDSWGQADEDALMDDGEREMLR